MERTLKLPGIAPVNSGEWLLRDDVFDQQVSYRNYLLDTTQKDVFQATDASVDAQRELLAIVLHELGEKTVPNTENQEPPIITAARLIQEDLLILENNVLTAAVLCFPASWTLSEKFGRGMEAIHSVVEEYTDDIAKRVARLFDAIRPEQPLWRANFMIYEDPELFQPRLEIDKRASGCGEYVRVERQTLRKLPETQAVIFGIHTYVVPMKILSVDERTELLKNAAHSGEG